MNISYNKKITNKKEIYLIGIHILIGLVASLVPSIVPLIISGIILVYMLLYSGRSKIQTLIFISYLTAMETLYRAAGVSFLPYELSKYIQVGFILVSLVMMRSSFKSFGGLYIILLLLPSLILFTPDTYKYFILNSLGILSLAIFIAFTGNQKIEPSDYFKIIKAFLLGCISFVAFITFKTPKFSEIEFSLGANFDTTGGFGPNQVATLLGAGICFLIIMIDKNIYIGNRLITFSLLIYFLLRALLSFSRGGVLGLLLSFVLSFLLFKKIKKGVFLKFGVLTFLFIIVFLMANDVTNGNLLLRYQGETAGTLAGTRVKNLQTMSSGRSNYAEVDLSMWYDNVIFGVGPGNSQFNRSQYGMHNQGAPHIEVTRLLAENGIFGLLINLILIFWPIYIIYKTPSKEMKFVKTTLFIFAYATTFHSAMRTGITPLFYALASMDISPFKLISKERKV